MGDNVSILNAEIDEKGTAKRVRMFLEKDLKTCLEIVNRRPEDLKSPVFDTQPKSTVSGNSTEQRIVEFLHAEEILKEFHEALTNSSDETKKLITLRYIDGVTDTHIQERMQITATPYRHHKRKALNEIANRLYFKKSIDDLHVYLNDCEG